MDFSCRARSRKLVVQLGSNEHRKRCTRWPSCRVDGSSGSEAMQPDGTGVFSARLPAKGRRFIRIRWICAAARKGVRHNFQPARSAPRSTRISRFRGTNTRQLRNVPSAWRICTYVASPRPAMAKQPVRSIACVASAQHGRCLGHGASRQARYTRE